MNLPKPPIGVTSTLILVALDGIWGVGEAGAAASVVGSVGIPFMSASVFVLCSVTITFLQRYVEGEEWGKAIAKGLACGILAGVPFPVFGAGTGAAMLGWAGLRQLGGGNKEEKPQIIEGTRRKE